LFAPSSSNNAKDNDLKKMSASRDARAKKLDSELLRMYRDDPKQLDELETSLKGLIHKVEDSKKKPVIDSKRETLEKELKKMEEMRESLKKDERRLEELRSCGDEKSLLQFFEEQGLSKEQIQRGLMGDTQCVLGHQKVVTSEEAEKSLKYVEDLDNLMHPEKAKKENIAAKTQTKQAVAPPPKKKEYDVLQPDFFQRKPTQKDPAIVITVCLPKLEGGISDVDLDVSDTHLRLRAPIPGDKEYMLSVPLSRTVLPDEVKAKWKAKQHELIVTLPLATSLLTH